MNLPHFHQNRKLSPLVLLTFIRPHIVDPVSNIILFEEFWACAMGTLFFDNQKSWRVCAHRLPKYLHQLLLNLPRRADIVGESATSLLPFIEDPDANAR